MANLEMVCKISMSNINYGRENPIVNTNEDFNTILAQKCKELKNIKDKNRM